MTSESYDPFDIVRSGYVPRPRVHARLHRCACSEKPPYDFGGRVRIIVSYDADVPYPPAVTKD